MKLASTSDAQKAGLKATVRRLVKMAGGQDCASMACRASRASIGFYANPGHDQHMPIDVVADLEADVGEPVVTRELARLSGYALVPTTAATSITFDVTRSVLQLTRELGELSGAVSDMDADGRRTINEYDRCIREVQDLKIAVDSLFDRLHQGRKALADSL